MGNPPGSSSAARALRHPFSPDTARRLVALALVMLLAACAGSVAPPTVIQSLSPEQRQSLRLTGVSADAGHGVVMTHEELDRITQLVTAEINAASPDMLLAPGAPPPQQAMLLKIVVTRYDEGNAFARFMLAGLGQIYLEGDVLLLDSETMQQIAAYKVGKDFSFGGLYGGSTTMHDVEKGFARSVADVVRRKT
jgi:hypothetical protein